MPDARPRLSVVILNFNRREETRATVEHLRRLHRSFPHFEIIAIDNGSHDGTAAYLRSQAPFVTPVLLENNLGIGGYNVGFERSRGDYLLVLDDDSHPVDAATLRRLVDVLDERPEVGLVACRIEDRQGRRVDSWHLPASDRVEPSMSFIGCGFAIRRGLFAEIGWYPAEFFLYQNEVEVAMRVWSRGREIRFEPGCRVVHRVAAQNRGGWRQVYFATRNSLWLIRRHYAGWDRAYLLLSRSVIGLVRAGQLGQPGAYWRGLREGWLTPVVPEPLPEGVRRRFAPFWRQNSLWHQLTGRA